MTAASDIISVLVLLDVDYSIFAAAAAAASAHCVEHGTVLERHRAYAGGAQRSCSCSNPAANLTTSVNHSSTWLQRWSLWAYEVSNELVVYPHTLRCDGKNRFPRDAAAAAAAANLDSEVGLILHLSIANPAVKRAYRCRWKTLLAAHVQNVTVFHWRNSI